MIEPYFDADHGCYHVPQCGAWNLQTRHYRGDICVGVSRSYGLSFNTQEAAQDRADLENVWVKVYRALNAALENGYEQYVMEEPITTVTIDLLLHESTLEDTALDIISAGVIKWRTNRLRTANSSA